MSVLLETRDLSMNFGGLMAVDNVSFAVESGEIRAVIGPNGAGKTTLVGTISGRIRPTGGRVLFDGSDITRLGPARRVRRGIVYTFQVTSIYARLSVYDNVALAAQRRLMRGLHGRLRSRRAELDAAVASALERVGLEESPDKPAGELAYGHQRLLEVAMGLALQPRLLILDEPTQGLAEGEIARFSDLVRGLAGPTTVLLIEHNMPVVLSLAHRVTVMDQGRVLAEGTPDEIERDADVQRAYLGG